jgi:hypothetical protein
MMKLDVDRYDSKTRKLGPKVKRDSWVSGLRLIGRQGFDRFRYGSHPHVRVASMPEFAEKGMKYSLFIQDTHEVYCEKHKHQLYIHELRRPFMHDGADTEFKEFHFAIRTDRRYAFFTFPELVDEIETIAKAQQTMRKLEERLTAESDKLLKEI